MKRFPICLKAMLHFTLLSAACFAQESADSETAPGKSERHSAAVDEPSVAKGPAFATIPGMSATNFDLRAYQSPSDGTEESNLAEN